MTNKKLYNKLHFTVQRHDACVLSVDLLLFLE